MNDYFARIVHPETVGQSGLAAAPAASPQPAEFGPDGTDGDIVELDFESSSHAPETPMPRQSATQPSAPVERIGPYSPDDSGMIDRVQAMAAPPTQTVNPVAPTLSASPLDEATRVERPMSPSVSSRAAHEVTAPDSTPSAMPSHVAPKPVAPDATTMTPPYIDAAIAPPAHEARETLEHALRWVRSAPVTQDKEVATPASPRKSFTPDAMDAAIRSAPVADASTRLLPPERPPLDRTTRPEAPTEPAPTRASDGIIEEDTVMLSIGAIHVRLEAPQSPPAARPVPPQRPDPTPGAAGRPSLATGLRRRCIHL